MFRGPRHSGFWSEEGAFGLCLPLADLFLSPAAPLLPLTWASVAAFSWQWLERSLVPPATGGGPF